MKNGKYLSGKATESRGRWKAVPAAEENGVRRANGKRGGRPVRGQTGEQARETNRRQIGETNFGTARGDNRSGSPLEKVLSFGQPTVRREYGRRGDVRDKRQV